ncbi:hypothetical protein K501DRAFT_185084, partial [Backusella circina FSU 941]
FIRKRLCEFKSLGTICAELMDCCLTVRPGFSGIGCGNMTVMIVAFLNGHSVQE